MIVGLYSHIIMRKQDFTIPNCITLLRIVGTIVLLFIEPMTTAFFVIYTFTGLTDAFDGFIARITNSVSELGGKLDSVADLIFYAVMLMKIFPVLYEKLPSEIWVVVAVILVLRLSAYVVSALKHKKFASLHTILNKATSFALFFVPYIISYSIATPICWTICVLAILSSSEELVIHITRKTTNEKILEKKA